MTTMPNRRIEVYFRSAVAADEVAGNLRPVVEVRGPVLVRPVDGRPYLLTIILPGTMSPLPYYPDEHLLARIRNIVMAHDGLTATPASDGAGAAKR